MRRSLRAGAFVGGLAIACLLLAAPAQGTHPRPKGATPFKVPLVPAYSACAAPNRTHGPPLAFASCNPPAQTSAQATVGTPDAFGGAANATGYLRLTVCLGCGHETAPDDILIDIELNDVRCVPTGARCGAANASGPADYSGEVRPSLTYRLTDHWNGTAPGGGTDAATVEDFTFADSASFLTSTCVQSASTSTGSTCSLHTSQDGIVPFSVRESRRSIWELHAVRIYDGGADGDGDTTADNTVFARPGVFIP